MFINSIAIILSDLTASSTSPQIQSTVCRILYQACTAGVYVSRLLYFASAGIYRGLPSDLQVFQSIIHQHDWVIRQVRTILPEVTVLHAKSVPRVQEVLRNLKSLSTLQQPTFVDYSHRFPHFAGGYHSPGLPPVGSVPDPSPGQLLPWLQRLVSQNSESGIQFTVTGTQVVTPEASPLDAPLSQFVEVEPVRPPKRQHDGQDQPDQYIKRFRPDPQAKAHSKVPPPLANTIHHYFGPQ